MNMVFMYIVLSFTDFLLSLCSSLTTSFISFNEPHTLKIHPIQLTTRAENLNLNSNTVAGITWCLQNWGHSLNINT